MHHRSPGFFAALRWGVYLSAGICAYAVLVQFALKPMHAREQGQEVFGFLNGLDRVLQAPGLKAGMYIGELHPAGHLPFRVWLFAVAFNALFYFSAGSLLECFWLWIRGDLAQSRVSRISRSKSDGNAEVQRLTRRGFLLCGMKLAGGGVLGGIGYSLVVEARWLARFAPGAGWSADRASHRHPSRTVVVACLRSRCSGNGQWSETGHVPSHRGLCPSIAGLH